MVGRGAAGAVSVLVVMTAMLVASCSSSSKAADPNVRSNFTTTSDGASTSSTGDIVTTSTTGDGGESTTTGTGVPVTNPEDGTQVTDPGTGAGITVPLPPSTTSTTEAEFHLQWKLAIDYRTHPGTNPFAAYNGGPKVWSLRQSDSLTRTGNYSLLPAYSRPFGVSGIAGWHGNIGGCITRPAIASNTNPDRTQDCTADIPGGAAFAYPGQTHLAVVAWTAPYTGQANITAGIADVDPACGDGVSFQIEKGTTNLSDIKLTPANAVMLPEISTSVTQGESVYFIVGPGPDGNNDCDATQLALQIIRPQ